MALLPLLALSLLVLLRWRPRAGFYRASLEAAVLWGTLVVLATEMLSLFRSLNSAWLSAFWGAACVAAGIFLARRGGPSCPLRHARTKLGRVTEASVGRVGMLVLVGLVYLVLALLLLALLAAPNNYDALTYHLPRIFHWAQNESVAHYPTHNPRQVYWGPGAEFAVLQLWILGAGDRFLSLVQWGAMVGSAVAVAWITQRLGGGRLSQLLAAAFVGTIPMGVLQSTTIQTDYLTAFWLVCFVAFGLGLSRDSESDSRPALFAGLALGLALLTKGTAYVFGAPFGVWIIWRVFRNRGTWSAARRAGAVLLVALALNAGHYARNVQLSGHPLGPSMGRAGILNQRIGPDVLFSNLVRNATLQFASSYRPANERLERAAVELHDLFGLDPSDPETTYLPGGPYRLHGWLVHETFSGNPLHLIILLGGLVGAFSSERLRRTAGPHALALAVAAILYLLLLRWQVFGSRLQLPWFVAGSPVAGLALNRLRSRSAPWVALVLLILAIPYVVLNPLKPLVGDASVFDRPRKEWYYWHRPDLQPQYERVAERALDLGCQSVGLVLGGDDMEYPLLLALRGVPRIAHYAVSNSTRDAAPSEWRPMCIIRTSKAAAPEPFSGYRKETSESYLNLWVRAADPSTT